MFKSESVIFALLLSGCGVAIDTVLLPEDEVMEGAGTINTRDEAEAHEEVDAAVIDAAEAGTADAGAEPELPAPVLYCGDRRHSPITPGVAAHLRTIVDQDLQDDVFAKVGASATASKSFMNCFAKNRVDLDGREELWSVIQHFRTGEAGGTDPFSRKSLAATPGWSADRVLSGDPSSLEQEIEAIYPMFAVVMYGTNDLGQQDPDGYGENLLRVVDRLLDYGVIPVVSSIMPRDDRPKRDRQVPLYNGLARAIAQARQIPFIDYHRELMRLARHGIGSDGIHPSTYRYRTSRTAWSCVLDGKGLRYGYNLRNLITIEALDRLWRVVVRGEDALDSTAPVLAGSGSSEDPFQVPDFPFTDFRDTTSSPWRRFDRYTGCGARQNESGPEWVYQFELDRPAKVRAIVSDVADADVDLHLLHAGGSEWGCIKRANTHLKASLKPGSYWLVVDTYSKYEERSGEYLLAVVAE